MYRVIASFLAIAIVALATATFAGESNCQQCGEPPCVAPSEAAKTYLAGECEFSPEPQACEKECRALSNACKAVVEANSKCVDGANKGVRSFDFATCWGLPKADRKACLKAATEQFKASTAALNADTAIATQACVVAFDTCAAACSAE